MANKWHLEILWQGIDDWNQWRKANPEIKPDLSEANLRETYLHSINLSEANLDRVNLEFATLRNADFRKSNLKRAILGGADLRGADLCEADLSHATLFEADVREANLSRADLRGTNLDRADLRGANLSEANLIGADLIRLDLSRVNFQKAQLQMVCFIDANLNEVTLTGACLWETQRTGWSIKGVICESVYWDRRGKSETEYAPGEFEKLFAEQTKIKLHYKGGINSLEIATLPALIQRLETTQDCILRFMSIKEDAGGAIVELAIEETEDLPTEKIESIKLAVQAEAKRDIQTLRQALASKEDRIKKLKGKVEGLKEIIAEIWDNHTGDTYNISGIVGAAGPNARSHDNTSNQIVSAENSSVETQIQGDRNVAIDRDASDGNIITGDNKGYTE